MSYWRIKSLTHISGIFVNYWQIRSRQQLSEQDHKSEVIYSKHIPQYQSTITYLWFKVIEQALILGQLFLQMIGMFEELNNSTLL